MHVRAYAKINLGLRILGKRDDGFHDIETLFHQVDCYDVIELRRGTNGEVSLISDNSDVPRDDTNICMQAAALLRNNHAIDAGAHISLEKGIPIGAGLGGGSSDAAAVLKGLSTLWHLDLTLEQLHEYAAQLGSDVPFFLYGGSAYATGRGEILKSIELSIPQWIVVVTPPVHVSTAWAYANIGADREPWTGSLFDALSNLPHTENPLAAIARNDFELLVCTTHQMVEELRTRFLQAEASVVSLCGSGSSVFGLFDDGNKAHAFASSFDSPYVVSVTTPFFKPESQHFLIKH